MKANLDEKVVAGFGDEWSRLDQTGMSETEAEGYFDGYFEVFPWERIGKHSVGFDLGCGSGRWARFVAPRVGQLHLIDPSEAIDVARTNLAAFDNCQFHRVGVNEMPFSEAVFDFGYCLGVLHHIPDTEAGLSTAVSKLKQGAPFLLYLYYRFDNKPAWFRFVWRLSDILRRVICRLPFGLRYAISQILAGLVYWPLSRAALLSEQMGINVENFPLAQYRRSSFYRMRTDALDRFGTSLEKRFTREEIAHMMKNCGLTDIRFCENFPWTAVGTKV